MPAFHRRSTSSGRKSTAATVYYDYAINPTTRTSQPCCYAECRLTGNRVGPVWGHGDASLRTVLATLTRLCDCPAEYHRVDRHEGNRLRA